MTRVRYTMPARSRGELCMQRATARTDEAVGVRGSNPRDAVKAPMEATGSNPRMSVCGRPLCLDDVEGGAA